MDIVFLIT